MIPGLFQYPAAVTRAHCGKAELLRPHEWRKIQNAGSVSDALNILFSTVYGEACGFSHVEENALPPMRTVEHAMRQSVIIRMTKIARFLEGAPERLVIRCIQKYDILNLKKTVRRLHNTQMRENHLAIDTYTLGTYSLLPHNDWDSFTTLAKCGEALENTWIGSTFSQAQAALQENDDLLLCEIRLEKAYITALRKECDALMSATGSREHIFRFIDMYNIITAARLRYSNAYEPAAAYPLLNLEAGDRFTEKVFWAATEMTDSEEYWRYISRIYHWEDEVTTERDASIRMRTEQQNACKITFRGSTSLHLSPVIALYFMKECEVDDIVMILQSLRLGIDIPQGIPVRAVA